MAYRLSHLHLHKFSFANANYSP